MSIVYSIVPDSHSLVKSSSIQHLAALLHVDLDAGESLQDWIKRRKVEEELENIEEQHQPSTSHSSLQPQTLRDMHP
nr:hypothetical protein CFP56_41553 [Quercus suber]